MINEQRPVIVESVDGSYKAEFESIKKAAKELFGGTQSGTSKIQSCASGRIKFISCPKLQNKLRVRYKY